MRLSSIFLLSGTLLGALSSVTLAAENVSTSPIVGGYETIRNITHTLYLDALEGAAAQQQGKAYNRTNVESSLFALAKAIDSTVGAVKAVNAIGEDVAKASSEALINTVPDIANVTAGLVLGKQFLALVNATQLTVITLQSLVLGFDTLYRATEAKVPKSYRAVFASLWSAIICDMDRAADALQPGVKITDAQYCLTPHKTHPNKHLHPKPKHWSDCKQKSSNVLKFGYQNNCWDNPPHTWCTATDAHPKWTDCTADWHPKKWKSEL